MSGPSKGAEAGRNEWKAQASENPYKSSKPESNLSRTRTWVPLKTQYEKLRMIDLAIRNIKGQVFVNSETRPTTVAQLRTKARID